MTSKTTLLISIICLILGTIGCGENSQKKPIEESPKERSSTTDLKKNTIEIEALIPDSIDYFTLNPYFENYLTGTPIFGKDFFVTLDYPKGEKRHPLKNNQFLFRIKGSIESKTGAAPNDFKLRLFTNQISDLKANKAQEEWVMNFEQTDNLFQFKMGNILMDIHPGIYYYTIEKTGETEPYFVGKISLL